MSTPSIPLDKLWDADAAMQARRMPWSIFAYPVQLADHQRLPMDEEARRWLAELLQLDLPVGIWWLPKIPDTFYFACPFEDRLRVHAGIASLEADGLFPVGFLTQRSEYLFSLIHPSP